MWKNVNHGVATQPEVASQPAEKTLPSAGKLLNDPPVSLQAVGENEDGLSTTATMTTYAEAVNEFTKNATACIGFLPLISKARDGYEQATKASAQLREVLDAGEESLRTVMTQLEQAISVHVLKSVGDGKRPEPSKVEAIRGNNKAS
jgi:flagellar hook-basal body complex protein FliE